MIRSLQLALVTVLASAYAVASDAGIMAASLQVPGALQSRARFDHVTSADGLSHDSVFAILQDRYGFMWFGTQGGLNRYDGYRVTQYRHDPRNSHSIAGDFVQILFEDSHGGIWAGRSVLSRFDPATETFTRFDLPGEGQAGARTPSLFGISEDRSGFIWLAMSSGRALYRLDPETGKLSGFDIGGDLPAGLDSGINGMTRDASGVFWLGTANGLVRFDPSTTRFTRYPQDRPNPNVRNDRTQGIAQDRTGGLWLATREGAQNFFDPRAGKFARRWAPPNHQRLGADSNHAIVAGGDGMIWMGTSEGLNVYDPQTGALAVLRNSAADRHSLSADEVLSLAVDRDGNLWVGTKGGGANRFSPASLRLGAWRRNAADPGSLSDENIRAIYRDSAGTLWLGTYDGGLNRFDPTSGKFSHFRHDPRIPGSLDDDRVYSILEDSSGALWVGTSQGINRLDRRTGTFTHFQRGPLGPPGSGIPVYSLFEDRHGKLWVGVGERTGTLDRNSGEIAPLPVIGGLSLHADRSGDMWIGSMSGLTRLDDSGKYRKMVLSAKSGNNRPPPVQINYVHEDAGGALWLATEAGLLQFEPKTEKYTSYTTAEGLPDNVIQCILPDQAGNLWLSTNSGISRFNPRERRFFNMHESDGLQGETFNRKACSVDPAGLLYFGGPHGFNIIDPRRIPATAPEPPQVALTEFRIHGAIIPPGPGSLLPRPIWDLDALDLSHRDDGFSLEFAALDFNNQARTRYRFKLEGLEPQWTEVDSRNRSARYTGLQPGHYRFLVQASTNGSTWGNRGAAITISIAPPWWNTPWSRGGLLLVVAGLLIGAYKLRVDAFHERGFRLQKLVDERTAEVANARDQAQAANRAKSAFLANMSHELRTPLNAILGFANLLRESGVSGDQREQIAVINRCGEHLLTLIDDILDVAKIEAGKQVLAIERCDLIAIVQDVIEMMRGRAHARNLALLCLQPADFPRYARADGPKLRQILINLLGNAVKFTEEGTVTLRLSAAAIDAERIRLRFEVEDTGIGMSPEDQARIFEPFVQLGQMAAQKGTGLGLAITRGFVEMMGGTLEVDSVLGRGSRFIVDVPLALSNDSTADEGRVSDEPGCVLEPGQPAWRVLIVEDNPENATVLEQMLSHAGFHVRVARNGALGVEQFQLWSPHFIWMDVRMPAMDGMEATRRIRELDGGREVKIAAMTASASMSEREVVMAAGMDDFLGKPYRRGEVFECMSRHLGVRYVQGDSALAGGADETGVLRRAALAALPFELRRDLADAVVSLDSERIKSVVYRVSELDESLASVLNRMGERFAYTAVLNAIRSSELEPDNTCTNDLKAHSGLSVPE